MPLNGIEIDDEQFVRLPKEQRDLLVFKNIQFLYDAIKGYKLQQKLQWWAIGALGTSASVLFWMLINMRVGQ